MLNDDIIKLINQGIIEQKELLIKLTKLGHNLTQSSISRKLKQLGAYKLHGKYQLKKFPSNKEKNIKITFVSPNLFIIKTSPGHASALASIIDEQLIENNLYPEFIGSLAGDDTIFLAVNLQDRTAAWAETCIKSTLES